MGDFVKSRKNSRPFQNVKKKEEVFASLPSDDFFVFIESIFGWSLSVSHDFKNPSAKFESTAPLPNCPPYFLKAKKVLAFFHQKDFFFSIGKKEGGLTAPPYFSKFWSEGGAVDSNFAELEMSFGKNQIWQKKSKILRTNIKKSTK